MQGSDHLLAARRQADEARRGTGGADPAVLASLAPNGVLFAVAAPPRPAGREAGQ